MPNIKESQPEEFVQQVNDEGFDAANVIKLFSLCIYEGRITSTPVNC
jgi:hypothetical protein